MGNREGVVTKPDGTKIYYKDNKIVRETDPEGNQVIRLNVTSKPSNTTGGTTQTFEKVDTAQELAENRQAEQIQAIVNENKEIDRQNAAAIEEYKTDLKEYYSGTTQTTTQTPAFQPANTLNLLNPSYKLTKPAPKKKEGFIKSFMTKREEKRVKELTKFYQTPNKRTGEFLTYQEARKKAISQINTEKLGTKIASAGVITVATFGSNVIPAAVGGLTSAGIVSSSGKEATKAIYTSQEQDKLLKSDIFKEVVIKSRVAEQKAQPNLLFKGLYEVNEGFGSMKGREAFVTTAQTEFKALGFPDEKAESAAKLAYRSRQISAFSEGAGMLTIGATSETVGRKLVTKATAKYGVKKGFTNILQTTFNPISKAGALEGAGSVALQQANRRGQINYKDVAAGGALGAFSAGTISGLIRVKTPLVKPISYVSDVGEFPSDKLADLIAPAGRRAGVRTFVPTSTFSNTKTSTKTQEQTFIKQNKRARPTSPSVKSKVIVPTFNLINTQTRANVPINPTSKTPTRPVPVNPNIKPTVNIQPKTPVNVPVNPNVPVNSNVPVNPNVPVNSMINTFTFNPKFPIIPIVPRGSVGRSFRRSFKTSFKQPKQYTPTLTSAVFNIKAKKGRKKRDISGLGLRPII